MCRNVPHVFTARKERTKELFGHVFGYASDDDGALAEVDVVFTRAIDRSVGECHARFAAEQRRIEDDVQVTLCIESREMRDECVARRDRRCATEGKTFVPTSRFLLHVRRQTTLLDDHFDSARKVIVKDGFRHIDVQIAYVDRAIEEPAWG